MMKPMDLAFTKDLYVASNAPADLDAILAAKPGAPLKTAAEGILGAGRDGYMDLDVIAFIRSVAAMAGQPVPEVADAEPITAAWTVADGRARWEYKIPLKAFAELAERAPPAPAQADPGF